MLDIAAGETDAMVDAISMDLEVLALPDESGSGSGLQATAVSKTATAVAELSATGWREG